MYKVYKIYNKKGDLVYIGCTKNLRNRLTTHKNTFIRNALGKDVYSELNYIEWEVKKDKKEAFELEKSLILKHQPRYNDKFNKNKKQKNRYSKSDYCKVDEKQKSFWTMYFKAPTSELRGQLAELFNMEKELGRIGYAEVKNGKVHYYLTTKR